MPDIPYLTPETAAAAEDACREALAELLEAAAEHCAADPLDAAELKALLTAAATFTDALAIAQAGRAP